MTEEKEIVPETNGEENKEDKTNGQNEAAADKKSEDTEAQNGEKPEIDPVILEPAIIRQVEYYFGDSNLPRDKFLREQVLLDDGWVPLEVLIKFNRLSRLSTDLDVIEKALKKSKSGIIEVENKKVRRNPAKPVPEMNEEHRQELMSRTIYAKGFAKDITLDQLLEFFKQYEEVENVIMRRYLDRRAKKKFFKGSVFVTFKTKEQAEKFIAMDSVKYDGTELMILRQADYIKLKQLEIENRRSRHTKPQNQNQEEKEASATETKEEKEFKLPTGTVLRFENCDEAIMRDDIRNALVAKDKDIDIAYIDHKIGQTEGVIRLGKENAAKEFLKLLEDGVLAVKDQKLTFKLLENEEEDKYLKNTIEEMARKRKNMKNFSKFKGRSNYKGKYGKRRRQDDDGQKDGPPAKVKADS